jgi:hypothetical protein
MSIDTIGAFVVLVLNIAFWIITVFIIVAVLFFVAKHITDKQFRDSFIDYERIDTYHRTYRSTQSASMSFSESASASPSEEYNEDDEYVDDEEYELEKIEIPKAKNITRYITQLMSKNCPWCNQRKDPNSTYCPHCGGSYE